MKVNISETSLAAYAAHADGSFSDRAEQAYSYLEKFGPKTANELFELMKHTFPTNYRHNTNARMSDLRDQGRVRVNCKRECAVSGETVTAWEIVPEGLVASHKLEALKASRVRAQLLVEKLDKEILAFAAGV